MAAMSLVEQELDQRLKVVEAHIAKLLERSSSSASGGGSSALTTRVKAVEGQITDFGARLDKIEADPQGLAAKSTPAAKK